MRVGRLAGLRLAALAWWFANQNFLGDRSDCLSRLSIETTGCKAMAMPCDWAAVSEEQP